MAGEASKTYPMLSAGEGRPVASSGSRLVKTVTTTTTTTTRRRDDASGENGSSVARVEELGRQAAFNGPASSSGGRRNLSRVAEVREQQPSGANLQTRPSEVQQQVESDESIEGNSRVTTISTIAAQSGQSRIVLAVLKDGTELQLKVQEMRPSIFEVGAGHRECVKYLEAHQKLVRNLRKQKPSPIEGWMSKYQRICVQEEPQMSSERKLVYMCMGENLQGCWRALLGQLDQRFELLRVASEFYEAAAQLTQALERADNHVQTFRQELLAGPNSIRFSQASNELRALNAAALDRYNHARLNQQKLIDLVSAIGTGNLGDSRVNHLISGAQELINYIANYLGPLERRRLQLESVLTTSKTTTTDFDHRRSRSANQLAEISQHSPPSGSATNSSSLLREITSFNDLNFVDNWLTVKIEQLNSSLLSSLGIGVSDTRSILSKHEQIALECRAIEEATLTFNGKNIHAIKSVEQRPDDKRTQNSPALFEKQKLLAQKARDVITILEARIVLLRRTIDFYLRSKEATGDVNRMMRRLQVDNSLQSVQFVSNELELKDVSSVVASGATIINELQQLQLAQQHGQRSRLVNLSLVTSGIRSIIDQLNQDLAHLKTVLNQRKLVLLNEDATKMATNFSSKCRQLQLWLNSHVKSFLLANNRAGAELGQVRGLCESHEQLRVAVQGKTLEVEALLRSLPTLTENFDAKSSVANEIQVATDELRRDWIEATNCLDKRLDLLKKYLAILGTVAVLGKELESLESFNSGRPTTPERTDEDIRANIDQSFVQLTNQVRNFRLDAHRKGPTELVYPSGGPTDDLNRQQMVEHADRLLADFTERRRRAVEVPDPASGRAKREEQPAHQRPQQVDPPRFTRVLSDWAAEPFSTVELECETDQADCRVEWFMNNFKRIPANIRHSTSSEGTQHRLTISNFSPICCGTYVARASNGSGQAVSQCRVRLLGIKEAQDEPPSGGQQVNPAASLWRHQQQETTSQQQTTTASNFQSHSPAVSTTSSFSQWRPTAGEGPPNETRTTRSGESKTMTRLIQGVGDSQPPESPVPTIKITQLASDSDTESTALGRFPVTQATYSGPVADRASQQPPPYIESPVSSATLPPSRSVSESPFEGSPRAPVFVRTLADSMPRSCSRAGLVCLVLGNPPPTIEWMHNNQTIASSKCPRSTPGGGSCRGSVCKLTIERLEPRTQGQYVCRATNRAGQSSTCLTLSK